MKRSLLDEDAVSIVFAAGRGTRMVGFDGNKTLLPLIPSESHLNGEHPLIEEVLDNLPPGPKGVVVHHKKQDLVDALRDRAVSFIDQPVTNGTGGALLSARSFLEGVEQRYVVITMGDVPLVRRSTYERLLDRAVHVPFVVLGFSPDDKAQYGAVETEGDSIVKITEWKYWKEYPPSQREKLSVFNAGIYAGDRKALLRGLADLEKNPHMVEKKIDGEWRKVEEYFITDLVELMVSSGFGVSWSMCEDETEVIGVDTPESLMRVQREYALRKALPAENSSVAT